MQKYFLHTGLHKTGTKFFQHKVFPNLDDNFFSYNPPKLCQLIADLMVVEDDDVQMVFNAIQKEKEKLAHSDTRHILISREIMSGDLFSFYSDYAMTHKKLALAFPEAHIICSLRYQLDWLISCYRETLHEHHYQTIQQFLGIKEGEDKFVKANYRLLDWSKLLDSLISLFPKKQLHILFYEDFKHDKLASVRAIAQILGLDNIAIKQDNDKIPNRGYSALSISLSIARYKLFKAIGLEKLCVHRPIVFFGKNGIPAGSETLSVLPHKKYWHNGFHRDNEEVRSPNYPDNLNIPEKIRMTLSWRRFIKQGIDKLVYRDWEMLKDEKTEMESYFKGINSQLKMKHSDIAEKLPSVYIE